MAEANALDDHTLEVVLREPRNYFPYVLASTPAYPWPRHVCSEAGEAWHERVPLVSSGPFVLTARDESGIVLEANPRWHGARGNVSRITIRFRDRIDDFEELWNDGTIDVMPSARRRSPGRRRGLRRDRARCWAPRSWVSGTDRPALADLRVRRAIAAAVAEVGASADRRRARLPPAGAGRPAPAGDARPQLRPAPSPPSMDEARRRSSPTPAIRTARGSRRSRCWTRGTSRCRPRRWSRRSAGWAWRRPSLSSDPDVILSGQDCDLWVCTWLADFPDPEGFFRGLIGDPADPIVNDAEAFALLDEARASRDRDERLRLYSEVDRRLVADQVLLLPISYSRATVLRRPWVQGVWANALTPLRLDQAVVERAADPAGHGAGVASSVLCRRIHHDEAPDALPP